MRDMIPAAAILALIAGTVTLGAILCNLLP